MSVKINRLFKKSKFHSLPPESKLFYIYLISSPDFNSVGVFSPNIKSWTADLGVSIETFREMCKELIKLQWLHVKEYNNTLYFIVPEHFKKLSKSESSITRVQKDLKVLPKELIEFLESIDITIDSKVVSFSEPTPEEVTDYALSKGYQLDGKQFIDYYKEQSERYGRPDNMWVDSRNKQVRDWRRKLQTVWFKAENKIKAVKNEPDKHKGFYITMESKTIFPEGWKDGEPYHSNFLVNREMKKQFNSTPK